jgi:hypothetical protein
MARPPKVTRHDVTEAINAVQWTLHGDDVEAAAETRKRGRLSGPDAMAFIDYVMRTDKFASVAQRMRAATTILAVGEFLSSEAKATGLFGGDVEDADGRAPS